MLFSKIIIRNKGCGGAKDGATHGGGKAWGEIFRILVLVIAGFVRLINNNET